MTEYIVNIEDLSFSRDKKLVFDKINLKMSKGSIVGIIGPSGTGKTTLLNLISGQLKPSSGSILVNQENISALSKKKLYEARRQMGMLFQSGALFTGLSVFENVAFPLRELTLLPQSMIKDIVLMKLEGVGLRGAQHLMPNQLSGGMARRVALARAMVLDPQLMMYDEPFTGLDPIAKAVIVELIKKLNQALGISSILVSHDIPETLSICDHVCLIANKKIIAQGSSNEIRSSKDPEVQQFILGLADGKIPFQYPAKNYREDLL